ncbi:hypothetical protein KFK09_021419 [Dendrobium nobile]|uniref:Uncharacterized protein n=1 Tax=Dendrobium nobile TaxID=94219 RepID=A0A8T3AQ32_DENNO|nr:hypothetical protein KFK09_021419 [Dendrobium nobile]
MVCRTKSKTLGACALTTVISQFKAPKHQHVALDINMWRWLQAGSRVLMKGEAPVEAQQNVIGKMPIEGRAHREKDGF